MRTLHLRNRSGNRKRKRENNEQNNVASLTLLIGNNIWSWSVHVPFYQISIESFRFYRCRIIRSFLAQNNNKTFINLLCYLNLLIFTEKIIMIKRIYLEL